jgi:hypothetical protein
MALSEGATYTFNITTQGGVTHFIAYQGSTQVWSLDAPTGGNYLVVSSVYSGYYNYTDYEEVWLTDTSGGSPAFDFYFYDNYWVPVRGGENAATWTSYSSGAPSNVAVIISGNSVLVHNPPSVAGAPAVSAQSANSLDLFFRGGDSALWWKHWSGATWSTAASQGGILTSDPAATSPGNGVVDVFVRGTDGAIWEKTTTNGGSVWSGWNYLGGQIPAGTEPTVCSWGAGRLDLFAQGTDGQLWWQYTTNGGGSWTGWQPLGGKLTSSAAAATAPGSSRIDVFVRGTDGAIWQGTTTNKGSSWSGWTSRGGQIPVNTIPAASSWGSGRLDLFANGTDGQLWWQYTTNGGGSWTGWQSLGGKLTSSPAAAAPASGIMDVFVRGSDNALWERTYNGGWSGWMSAGGI